MTTAFNRGREAYERGDGEEMCPYDDDKTRDEWLNGWAYQHLLTAGDAEEVF